MPLRRKLFRRISTCRLKNYRIAFRIILHYVDLTSSRSMSTWWTRIWIWRAFDEPGFSVPSFGESSFGKRIRRKKLPTDGVPHFQSAAGWPFKTGVDSAIQNYPNTISARMEFREPIRRIIIRTCLSCWFMFPSINFSLALSFKFVSLTVICVVVFID